MAASEFPLAVAYGKSGKPELAPERFNTTEEMRAYNAAMISADNLRSNWRTRVEAQINGNQPVNPAVLRERKLSWSANCNYRGAEGFIDTQRTSFYDLVTEVDPCIEVHLDYGKGSEKARMEDTIAKHFTWLMLSKWRVGFNYHVPLHQREMLVHGIGAHVWPQMNDCNWFPRTPRAGTLLFPEGTSSLFETEGEAFLLRDFVPTHQLYRFVNNESAASALGWNPDTVWEVMAKATKSNTQTSNFKLDEWKRKEKSGDQGGSMARQSGVWINWLFVKEIETGKISLYALAEGVETKDYLFKKRNVYDEWPLALFPYDIGNGDLHSIRGLGARGKDFFELDDRIKNSMANQVLLGNTIPLQQTGSIDPSKMKLTKMGVMSILPQNVQIATGFRFPDLSQGPIALSRELQGAMYRNNESYTSGGPEAKDRETATSFMMRSQDSAQITKGTHGLYGSHLCVFYEKIFGMIVKASKRSGSSQPFALAKELMRRCERDGVPAEAFDHVEEITEVLSNGAGSAAARFQNLGMLMQTVFPHTTQDRKINMLRDITAAAVSGAKADRYAPSLDDEGVEDSDDSIITLENNDLLDGKQATVTDAQDQVRHAFKHLESAGTVIEALQGEAMDLQGALGALMAHGAHITAHLERLSQNPQHKAEAAEVKKALGELAQVVKQVQSQLERERDMMPEQEPEQAQSEQFQIGMAKVQSDAEIKRAKMQNDARLKFEKQRFNQQLADIKTASELTRGSK